MRRFRVLVKDGAAVLASFEVMSSSRFDCVLAHMDFAEMLGGYAVAYPMEEAT